MKKIICLLAVAAAAAAASTPASAGPFRRRAAQAQPAYQYRPAQSAYGYASASAYAQSSTCTAAGCFLTGNGTVVTATATASADSGGATATVTVAAVPGDALDEVNALRAARGLRPYVRDDGLTRAAADCASARAASRLFGHTGNDFAYCRYGSSASATGCAAYPASYGFLACCIYDRYTYAGAVSVVGSDGRSYHSLFVR